MNYKFFTCLLVSMCLNIVIIAQPINQLTNQPINSISKTWVADNGDGTYKNPILHADYSDPDAIRVGKDFYMTASSFNQVPGLPILHSFDLVNWRLINTVFTKQPPFDRFDKVVHGGGVWAPSIRFHKGEFYIYYPDPDEGIWMVKSKNPAGEWSEPLLVKKAKGWIDPCPFWDENGNAYLVNGLAGSRAGIKSVLIINKMSSDGTKLLDNGVIVFDGHANHPTVEGPKLYKRNDYYYILAPAGGVATGWQLALRSKNIYGLYEEKIVLEQGKTNINGPHQGAWVDTQKGESWFLHFQDKDVYGRVVHLQPVSWENDWPLIGIDNDRNGVGEPVESFKKPNVGKTYQIETPPESDEFNTDKIGLQWQWAANPQPNFAFPAGSSYGFLRLFNVPIPEGANNLWNVPNLLTQKFPAPEFTATTKCTFTARTENEEVGMIIMGLDYGYISIKKSETGFVIRQATCENAEAGNVEIENAKVSVANSTLYFRVNVSNNANCIFSYSADGIQYYEIGKLFLAKKGKWIGAKIGLFAIRQGKTYETGYADFDWFRFEKLAP